MTVTGLFGGSFNPIHRGHLALAQTLCEQEGLDECWFMVSPMNPFKQNMELLADSKRLELVRLAIEDDPRLVACDFEFRLPKPSYTYHTLLALREAYPHRRFILIIGGDNWLKFPKWFRHEEILQLADVWVYPRPGFEAKTEELPEHVRLVKAPLFDYSSTDVRNAIAAGEDAAEMLPPAVWKKIQEEKIYANL